MTGSWGGSDWSVLVPEAMKIFGDVLAPPSRAHRVFIGAARRVFCSSNRKHERVLKFTLEAAAATTVFPAVLAYCLARAAVGAERAFPGWSQAFALLPGLTGAYLRRAFYRRVLPRCEDGCWLSFAAIFSHPTAEIGRNVYVGPFCCLGDVTLEDDVLIGSHVSITNGSAQHGTERLDIPIREQPGVWPRDDWPRYLGRRPGRDYGECRLPLRHRCRIGGDQADTGLRGGGRRPGSRRAVPQSNPRIRYW